MMRLIRDTTRGRIGPSRLTAIAVSAILAGAAYGCSGSNSSSSSAPSQTIATDILTGTVPAAVNGVLQSSSNFFSVGQGGGNISVTLTSAIETLPGGTLLPTVTMGLSIGTGSPACTALANAFTTATAGSSPQLSGSLAAGTYCVTVSDVTGQVGPVAYAVAVSHP